MGMTTVNQQMVGIAQPAVGIRQAMAVPVQSSALLPTAVAMESKVLDKRRLQELVKEVDPLEQLDDDVEEVNYTVKFSSQTSAGNSLTSFNVMVL